MKVEVGFITAWRRAIFFTFVGAIILFGVTSTLCQTYIGPGLITNVVTLAVLLVCIVGFILVLADKWGLYSGFGTAVIESGIFIYNDKKRHYNISVGDMVKVDIEKIRISSENSMSANFKSVLAYRILIQTANKKYYIESDRAAGRQYNEVDLYNLYLYLQKARS